MTTKQNIINYANRHALSVIAVIISILLGSIPCLICIYSFLPENKWTGICFFLPTVIIAFLCYLSNLFKAKYLNIIKTFVILLNLLILLIVQTFFAYGFFCILTEADADTVINTPERYSVAIKSLGNDIKIAHFPKIIPPEAQNTVIYKESSSFFGGDIVYLRFVASKEYIEKEIKKNTYIEIEGPYYEPSKYTKNHPREWIFNTIEIISNYPEYRDKIEGYRLYVIGNQSPYNSTRPCEFGIAINDKKNTIIYYASDFD